MTGQCISVLTNPLLCVSFSQAFTLWISPALRLSAWLPALVFLLTARSASSPLQRLSSKHLVFFCWHRGWGETCDCLRSLTPDWPWHQRWTWVTIITWPMRRLFSWWTERDTHTQYSGCLKVKSLAPWGIWYLLLKLNILHYRSKVWDHFLKNKLKENATNFHYEIIFITIAYIHTLWRWRIVWRFKIVLKAWILKVFLRNTKSEKVIQSKKNSKRQTRSGSSGIGPHQTAIRNNMKKPTRPLWNH